RSLVRNIGNQLASLQNIGIQFLLGVTIRSHGGNKNSFRDIMKIYERFLRSRASDTNVTLCYHEPWIIFDEEINIQLLPKFRCKFFSSRPVDIIKINRLQFSDLGQHLNRNPTL